MRYSPTHKAETRNQLLKASAALAKKNGFSATGVDALVEAAGVTSGAFYNHFRSKSELFTELVRQELEKSEALRRDTGRGTGGDRAADDWALYRIRRYLTWKHVQKPESGCPVPTLGAEIARADKATRQIFEDALKRAQQHWAEELGDEQLAWAVISQLAGSVLLARAMASDRTAKEVLEASKVFLENALPALRKE